MRKIPYINLLAHQKRGVIFSLLSLGVISPPLAFSWIDNSYYLIALVHGLSGFELLNHGTHSAIFNAIVCSDLTSHTVIQIDPALFFFQRFQSVRLCALSHLSY